MHKLVWEKIDDAWPVGGPPDGFTYRAKVPGGWLVSVWAGEKPTKKKRGDERWGGGLTFFPDEHHSWDVPLKAK